MKASFQIFTALAALVAASMFATTAAIAQPTERWSKEPLTDKHDFINPQESPDAANSTIELEKLFWMCDYAATGGGLEAHEIEMCGAVTQQLQRVKFDDDFDKLLAWWRVNKEPQHLALAGAGVIGSCGEGDKQ